MRECRGGRYGEEDELLAKNTWHTWWRPGVRHAAKKRNSRRERREEKDRLRKEEL